MGIRNRVKTLVAVLVILVSGAYAAADSAFVQKKLFYPFFYQGIVYQWGLEYGVDPFLIASVIRTESKFSPQACSPKGAVGLMQIMPETGGWVAEQLDYPGYEREFLVKPEVNIRFGVWYLASLQREFYGNEILVLSAYNGGRGNVKQWMRQFGWSQDFNQIDQIPFRETREYVGKVLRDRERYRSLYGQ